MRHLAIHLCVLGCVALAATSPALADVKTLLEQGKQQFSQAKFKAAIDTLERARKETRDAKLLGQIYLYLGLSNAVVGDTDRGRECFATALGYDPEVKLDIRQFKEDLVSMLEEVRARRLGTLKVTADAPGGSAVIDDGQPQPLPLTVSLAAGPHAVKVSGPDGQVWLSETVTIVAKQEKALRAVPPRTELQPAPPVAKQPSFWGRKRIWTWVALGGAVAFGIGSAVCLNKAEELCGGRDGDVCVNVRNLQGPEREERDNEVEKFNKAAWIAGGIGGGLLATSVVLLFLEGRPPNTAGKRALRLEPLVGQASGLQLVGRF